MDHQEEQHLQQREKKERKKVGFYDPFTQTFYQLESLEALKSVLENLNRREQNALT